MKGAVLEFHDSAMVQNPDESLGNRRAVSSHHGTIMSIMYLEKYSICLHHCRTLSSSIGRFPGYLGGGLPARMGINILHLMTP